MVPIFNPFLMKVLLKIKKKKIMGSVNNAQDPLEKPLATETQFKKKKKQNIDIDIDADKLNPNEY